ncbi:hypothetical protein [Frigoribacterium salinisoli]
MPRRLVTLAAAALGLALVGGAAATGAGAAGGADRSPRTAPITVAVWNDTARAGYAMSLTQLEEMDPDLDVEVTVLPREDRDDVLAQGFVDGTAPDVFWLDARSIRAHAEAGHLVDVDAALGSRSRSAWSPALVSRFSSDGTLWGVPQHATDVALVGNASSERREAVARVLAWAGSVDGQAHLGHPAG